jgi:quercetin dioxygenase-like cupin family protein
MHTVLDVATLEGRRKPVARAIGAQAVRLNRFDSGPGQEGFAHDERESGQEEIYIPIQGAGVLRIGAEEVALAPGRFVLVSADETRQVIAGPEGLTYIAVGAYRRRRVAAVTRGRPAAGERAREPVAARRRRPPPS